jgi:FKBP-type peptidyl-prolyl cis-trans isomerase SlyD
MKIKHNAVVRFHYRLRDEETGNELENSHGEEPNTYLHGRNAIVPGLESAMTGKEAGDIFSVTLEPEEGFGLRNEGQQQRVPLKHLMGQAQNKKKKPKVGDVVSVNTSAGPRKATVIKVGKFNVDLDANHPLSGKILTFDIEVVDVREATPEEVEHGHAHGPGGHQH